MHYFIKTFLTGVRLRFFKRREFDYIGDSGSYYTRLLT